MRLTFLSGCCFIFFLFIASIFSCNNTPQSPGKTVAKADTLTPEQQHLPENALQGLAITNGLIIQTMATEPMLRNPTNIDVDDRGRVWVTEAYNYRPAINNNPTTPLGDRIMILQDNDGDGKADTAKVFYQGPEINAPLGICVLGNKIIVSQSPYVWVFYDDNGDDRADRKEILFQGIGGEQHDHGAHAFTFGPDGKFYFNFGNEGKTLKDRNGKDVRDQDGDIIGPKKYKQGMVFRCDTNGSHVECLAHNFRNPYEVAVDSYGTLWQSDNDDDGNRSTRINYVMQFGNYGYTDEMTGAGWQANRTNVEDSTPERHWHLNDPGVVPNLLPTGAGSPTGMVVYEGSLLPAQFHDQLIHCDAGPNVVRSYPVKKNGAGYTAEITDILKGKDQWFRPSDICVAPDGSLIIADWYDPGVGGHAAGDQNRGRIYRVSVPGVKYTVPEENYNSAPGAIAALQNPNLSVRYHAWVALTSMDTAAVPELEKLWISSAGSRMRARAFWLLMKMPRINSAEYINQALKDPDPDLRILAIRATSQSGRNSTAVIEQLVNDPDPQVRRECALALHHNRAQNAASLWATVAAQYDGKDRWYLEALGIGADGQWDKFLPAYLAKMNDPLQSAAAKDIIWRARTDKAIPYIAKLASDRAVVLKERLKYFRAFDFNTGPAKSALLLKIIEDNKDNDIALNKLVLHHLDSKTVMHNPLAQETLTAVLQSIQGTDEYLELLTRFEVRSQNNTLLQLALDKPRESIGRSAAGLLLKFNGAGLLNKVFNGNDTAQQHNLVEALSRVGATASVDLLQYIALSPKYSTWLKKQAAESIGKSNTGEDRVLLLLKTKRVPALLIPDVVAGVRGAWRQSVRKEAESYLPGSGKENIKEPPPLQQVASLTSNAGEGLKIFTNTCSVCHKVNEAGSDFGPKLTEIGSKLPAEGLYEAIVHPSAGISFGYEGWEMKMKDGSVVTGVISSRTKTDVELKLPGGVVKNLKASDIMHMQKMKASMMTEGLYANMSAQDMANLLGYLKGLKKK